MKRSDLFREYARVIDLCEGTKVSPPSCVKYDNMPFNRTPDFIGNLVKHEFALAIVEDRPVFAGDVLYGSISGDKFTVDSEGICRAYDATTNIGGHIGVLSLTWIKPDESNTVSLSNVFGISNEIIKVKVTKSGTGKISAKVVE